MKKLSLLTIAWLVAALPFSALCGNVMDRNFSWEEQDLWNRHLYMFTHLPDQPSGHSVVKITGPKGSGPCLDFNFGREDYTAARAAGVECVVRGLRPQDAVNVLLAKAKERYPGILYFIKTYVDVASAAYNTTHP